MKTAKLPTVQLEYWIKESGKYEQGVKDILVDIEPYIRGEDGETTNESLKDFFSRLVERYDNPEIQLSIFKTACGAYQLEHKELHHNIHFVIDTYWKAIRDKRENSIKSVKR